MVISRREMLAGLSAALVGSSRAAAATDAVLSASTPSTGLVAGTSMSTSSAPVAHQAGGAMRFGYAAITWGSALTQAIDDIAAVGFRGIQPRIDAVQQFGDRPAAFKELLQQRGLTFAVLSSGNLSIDPAREEEMLATHVRHAQFMRDAGGLYLQVIDERPRGRAIVADDYRRLGRLLTTLGQRTADLGIPLVYHHHMNSLGEQPHEVDAVLDAADSRSVRVLFDVAHFQQAGGDPAAGIRKYASWIQVLHLKDVRRPGGFSGATGPTGPAAAGRAQPAPALPTYQFVELGRGRVDLVSVFAALAEARFDGWAIVELDRVPEPGGSPKASAEINKRYLIETLHQTV